MRLVQLLTLGAVGFAGSLFGQAPRFPQMKLEDTSGDQRAIADRMMKETRVGIGGPWNIMLRSPGMAEGVMSLYNYYRRKTTLPPNQMEFGVLITAREWNAQFEWFTHYPLAVAAGVSPAVLADLRAGKRPANMKPEEVAEYDFATELLRKHVVSDATFRKAKDLLGEKNVVDLTGLVGTYVAFGALINVSEVEVKAESKNAPDYLPVDSQ